jgi:hypothetical protein
MTLGKDWVLSNAASYSAVFGTESEFTSMKGDEAVNEATDGYLNSVVIAWDRLNVRAAFHEVVWAKFA